MLRITYERLKLGWSKATLARKAQMDQSLVSKLETGRFKPYPAQLRRLAIALRFPEGESKKLFEEVDERGYTET